MQEKQKQDLAAERLGVLQKDIWGETMEQAHQGKKNNKIPSDVTSEGFCYGSLAQQLCTRQKLVCPFGQTGEFASLGRRVHYHVRSLPIWINPPSGLILESDVIKVRADVVMECEDEDVGFSGNRQFGWSVTSTKNS